MIRNVRGPKCEVLRVASLSVYVHESLEVRTLLLCTDLPVRQPPFYLNIGQLKLLKLVVRGGKLDQSFVNGQTEARPLRKRVEKVRQATIERNK